MAAALGGLFGGMFAAMAYMQVTTLSRLGAWKPAWYSYFSVEPAIAGGITMLFTGISPFPGWSACGYCPGVGCRGPGLYDQGLCLGRQQEQHPGRRQSAVLGIVFAALLSLVLFHESILWDRLGRHCAHRRQRSRSNRLCAPG